MSVHPLLGMRHVTNFSRSEAPLTQLLDMDIGLTDPRGEGDVFFPEKGIGKWMGKLSESATSLTYSSSSSDSAAK